MKVKLYLFNACSLNFQILKVIFGLIISCNARQLLLAQENLRLSVQIAPKISSNRCKASGQEMKQARRECNKEMEIRRHRGVRDVEEGGTRGQRRACRTGKQESRRKGISSGSRNSTG